jgi:hypothetical protein
MPIPHAFLEALPSLDRAPELSHEDDLFGHLIGSRELEAILYGANGEIQTSKGELHMSWVLKARAIRDRDLFIFPDERMALSAFRRMTTDMPRRSTSRWKENSETAPRFAGVTRRSRRPRSITPLKSCGEMARLGTCTWNCSAGNQLMIANRNQSPKMTDAVEKSSPRD